MAGSRYRRGDIVWIPFTYSDFSGGKTRPALVVSTPDFAACAGDFVVAAITGQVGIHAGHTTCHQIQQLQGTGLAVASVVTSHFLTLSTARMGARAGRLAALDLVQVENRWRRALGLSTG